MGETKFQRVVVVFFVVVLALIFISTRSIIRSNERVLSETRQLRSEFRNEIRGVENSVERSLEAFEKENLWYRTSDFEIETTDQNFEDATITYELELNEYDINDHVYLVLTNEKTKETMTYEFERNGTSLSFTAEMELATKYNYEAEIIRETGSVRKSYIARGIYLAEYISEMLDIDIDFEGGSYNHTNGTGSTSFNVYVYKENYNKYFKNFKFDIASIEADIYINKELVETIDLINDTKYTKDTDSRKYTREFYDEDILLDYRGTYTFEKKLAENEMFNEAVIVRVTDSTGRVFIDMFGGHEDYEYYYQLIHGELEDGKTVIKINW